MPRPLKRDSVLVIHLDGVTACLVAHQRVQVVARRNLELVEPRDQVERFKRPPCAHSLRARPAGFRRRVGVRPLSNSSTSHRPKLAQPRYTATMLGGTV